MFSLPKNWLHASYRYLFFVYTQLNDKIVLFLTIQLNTSHLFTYQIVLFDPLDKTLSGAATAGKSGPGSNGNRRVLHIPQSSSITGASPSDKVYCHIQDTYWGKSYPLQICSQCIQQTQLTGILELGIM